MAKTAITAVQRRVLRQMVEANTTVMTVKTRGGQGAFFRGLLGEPEGRRVRVQTMWMLKDKGLVRDISDPEWRWRGHEYEITEAGRKVVEEARG